MSQPTEYREYIAGEVWKIRRRKYLETHSWCQRCSITDAQHVTLYGRRLDVHHLSYARLGGEEPDEDLMALCRPCHRLREKVGRVTELFIPLAMVPQDRDMNPVEYWQTAISRIRRRAVPRIQQEQDVESLLWLSQFANQCLRIASSEASTEGEIKNEGKIS